MAEATHWQLCQAIGGDADGAVTLLLRTPAGAERTLTLPRQSLPFKPLEFGVCAGVRGQRWGGGPLATVGYVRIPTFCYPQPRLWALAWRSNICVFVKVAQVNAAFGTVLGLSSPQQCVVAATPMLHPLPLWQPHICGPGGGA